MQDADIDRIVLEYCKKRGCVTSSGYLCKREGHLQDRKSSGFCRFARTEALLRQEAGVDAMALAPQRLHVNSNGIVENVLYSLADHSPKQYADSFHRLAAWVDNSLDQYRVRRTRLMWHAGCINKAGSWTSCQPSPAMPAHPVLMQNASTVSAWPPSQA